MGMDLDFLAAKDAIERLINKLRTTPHGEREALADRIILAVDKIMEENYE